MTWWNWLELALFALLGAVALFAKKLIEHEARGVVDERLEVMKAGFAEELESKRAALPRELNGRRPMPLVSSKRRRPN